MTMLYLLMLLVVIGLVMLDFGEQNFKLNGSKDSAEEFITVSDNAWDVILTFNKQLGSAWLLCTRQPHRRCHPREC